MSRKTVDCSASPVYFAGWESYSVPFKPIDPISKEDAERRRSYYIAYYDVTGKLSCFEKYLDGQLEWCDEYTYWENGKLRKRRLTRKEGSSLNQYFNQKGKIIPDA